MIEKNQLMQYTDFFQCKQLFMCYSYLVRDPVSL